jgi:hypothetical protein
MKLTVNDTPRETQMAAKVYINDVEQKHSVTEVDDEAQTATVYVRTANGKPLVIGFGNNRRIATRKITKAKICIVIPAGVPLGPYETPNKD